MNKPNFRPIAPLDADDAALERVNDTLGVPTMVRPPAKSVLPPGRPVAAPSRRQKKVTFRGPEPVIDALKLDALTQRTTVRNLILLALRDKGYLIIDEDLLPGAGGSD